jgi:two-component system, NarL family, nitrate/nitrite response regulator NarL
MRQQQHSIEATPSSPRGWTSARAPERSLAPGAPVGEGRRHRSVCLGASQHAMIRVVVAVDVRLYREGLANALAASGCVQVLATADSAQDAHTAATTMHPDVLLLDISMPGSLELVQTIATALHPVRVIALALEDDEVMECAEAGIAGFVRRGASLEDVVATIQSVARGELVCSPQVAAALLRRLGTLAATHRAHPPLNGLTRREREIVELIDQGLSNKDIARRLSIEVATVKNHIHNLLEKLRLHRRGEAAAYVRTAALPHGPNGRADQQAPNANERVAAPLHPASAPQGGKFENLNGAGRRGR